MKQLTVIIPMGGYGKRFSAAGYIIPKPFLPVHGKTMLENVIENMTFKNRQCRFVLVARRELLEYVIELTKRVKCDVVFDDEMMGAANGVYLTRGIIDDNDEILIVNSDQLLNWTPEHFIDFIDRENADGAIVTFHSHNPKWSFVQIDESGAITYVKEKEPISNIATAGIFYFRRFKDFRFGFEEMIRKRQTVNDEYYVAPVYNNLIIPRGLRVLEYPIPVGCMHGLGIPEDYERYINAQ
jgi:NDP-sugar pyrophosphorylase family protein